MAEIAEHSPSRIAARPSPWSELIRKEDWWAIWIGLGLVGVAIALFASGSSIKWIAVAPQKWSHLPNVAAQLHDARRRNMRRCSCCGRCCSASGAAALGIKLSQLPARIPGALCRGAAPSIFWACGIRRRTTILSRRWWRSALGLLISNTVGVPRWLEPGLRVEFYIKTGIVLLGAGLPLTLIAWAGPVAIVQAAIVSLVTFGSSISAPCGLGWTGGSPRPWERAARCAAYPARSPSAARWARRRSTFRSPSRWWSSGPSS